MAPNLDRGSARTVGGPENKSRECLRPIRVGISACLLGQKVRYDGGHKRDRFIAETLGEFFDWVPVCPEVELGLGTPRDPIRLEAEGDATRLVMPAAGRDLTREMDDYARRRIRELRQMKLCGYILKSKSPSCGKERVMVYGRRGRPVARGRGAFAARLMEAFPNLPVEDERHLAKPRLRRNWIGRVFAYRVLTDFWASRWNCDRLVRLHARHEPLLRAHAPQACRGLGRLLGAAEAITRQELRRRYTSEFMKGLARIDTRRGQAEMLEHFLSALNVDGAASGILLGPARD
jgi:uncharacterized protein YbbK (DUF523 family)